MVGNQGEPLSAEGDLRYPNFEIEDYEPRLFSHPVFSEADKGEEASANEMGEKGEEKEEVGGSANDGNQTQGRYFFYDSPHSEETGAWIPVSFPPIDNTNQKWEEGLSINGGYIPNEDMGWDQFLAIGGDKQLTINV